MPIKGGDPLCPLGFHPQVRWPTRCKRCFRDFKEHVSKKPTLNDRSSDYSENSTSSSLHEENSNSFEKQDDEESDSLEENASSASIRRRRSSTEDPAEEGEKTRTRRRRPPRLLIQSLQEVTPNEQQDEYTKDNGEDNPDVAFIIQVKSTQKPRDDDDATSIACTETTDTTLVEESDAFQEQLNSLKSELDRTKERCEQLEREKGELLNQKRFGNIAEGPGGSLRSELLRLQRQVHEFRAANEDLVDDQKSLRLKVQELEEDLESRVDASFAQKDLEDTRVKLQASESMLEELMEENATIKREMQAMVDEMEELQDNFREDQADEYSNVKKELEQAAKNCRVLQFKLRKADRKIDQLEAEKREQQLRESPGDAERLRQLENELAALQQKYQDIETELEQVRSGKSPTPNGRLSPKSTERAPLKRNSSQEDPAILLRDLQASLEREADLREQLRFAEEEAQTFRKNLSRVEDENESLLMQLKKMANKQVKNRRSSPSPIRVIAPEKEVKEDEESDENPTELKIQLELNEQEATVLRRRVEELEGEKARLEKELLEEKHQLEIQQQQQQQHSTKSHMSSEEEQQLRRKLIEKEREAERLQAELANAQPSKGGAAKKMVRSRSLEVDSGASLDLKRQLTMVEQEATVLRTKIQQLEAENEKLSAENKKLSLKAGKPTASAKSAAALEKQLKEAQAKIKELETATTNSSSTNAVRSRSASTAAIETLKKEKDTLQKEIAAKDDEIAKLKKKPAGLVRKRSPKKVTDLTSRVQLKKMVEELEDEVGEYLQALKLAKSEKGGSEEVDQMKEKIASLESELARKKDADAESSKGLAALQNELEEERLKIKDFKGKVDELSRNHSKATDELSEKEKKLAEVSEKLKKNDKLLKERKEKLAQVEKELDAERDRLRQSEGTQKEVAVGWLKERDDLKTQIQQLSKKLAEQEKNLSTKDKQILEGKSSKEELGTLRGRLEQIETQLKTVKEQEKEFKTKDEKSKAQIKKLEAELKKLKDDEEKNKLHSKKMLDSEDKFKKLKTEYDEIKRKCDQLEDDYSSSREKLLNEYEDLKSERDDIENQLSRVRETYNSQEDAWIKEKLALQATVKELESKRSDGKELSWSIEKQRLKERLEEKQEELDEAKRNALAFKDQILAMKKEHDDLRRKLDDFEKVSKVQQRNLNMDTFAQDKEIRELKNKLLQEERSHKTENSQLKMKCDAKLASAGEEVKTYQAQLHKVRRERDTFREMMEGAQKTIAQLRAQASSSPSTSPKPDSSELELMRVRLDEEQRRVGDLEDELADSKVEQARLRTEMVNERSAAELKASELQTKINELEEDRLLSTGRSQRVVGMRTRMELAWQKEREEQQRLLHESATLARDLRQTLFEVERERDRERLESKRRVEQLKRTMDEEQEETRRKISEVQFDLLELRDAHAKLRTTNEKIRRDKERAEKDREDARHTMNEQKRTMTEEQKIIGSLLQQAEELAKLFPDDKAPKKPPIGPKVGISSTLTKPAAVNDDVRKLISNLSKSVVDIRKIMSTQEHEADMKEKMRRATIRRAASASDQEQPSDGWRSIQTLPHNTEIPKTSSGVSNSLHRKSLSLEQTNVAQDQMWKLNNADDMGGGSNSSLQSLQSDIVHWTRGQSAGGDRDVSVDRLSTGSTKSEVIPGVMDKKKSKKGLLGKFKFLGKSSSLDEPQSSANSDLEGSDSNLSTKSNKAIKERLGNLFSKKSSSASEPGSRASSADREDVAPPLPVRSDSQQRPLVPRTGSSSSLHNYTTTTTPTVTRYYRL